MSLTIADNATLAALVQRIEVLEQGQDALDRGLVDAGVTADRALARADHVENLIGVAFDAAGLEPSDDRTATFSDPVSARIQARRRRIERSGFRLIYGDAS